MSDPILQRNITRTHLEHQIAATISLKSVQEHQYWLQTYVKFLSSDEDVNRLEELCSDMMGPFNA
jgi:protein HIRA/HIR1